MQMFFCSFVLLAAASTVALAEELQSLTELWSSFKVSILKRCQVYKQFNHVSVLFFCSKTNHGKNYESTVEENFRRTVFEDNILKIERHNRLYDQGKVTFKLGLNKYADLLHAEFMRMHGYNRSG